MGIVPFPSTNDTWENHCICPVVACNHGPGYRFVPKDSVLIVEYLDRKIKNEILPCMLIIKDVNLYAFSPEQLAEILPSFDGVRYCFTQRNRNHPKGSRPSRAAGNGYWKATIADREVKVKGRTIGFKKALVFFRGKKKTNWIMHEFTTVTPSPNQDRSPSQSGGKNNQDTMKLDGWVVCRFYEKKKGRGATIHNHMDDDHGVSAAMFDDDEMTADSYSCNMNGGGQYMYNADQNYDHQAMGTLEGNAANVPVMAGRHYYINDDIVDVPPTGPVEQYPENTPTTQLGSNQGPIVDQSRLDDFYYVPQPVCDNPPPAEGLLPLPGMDFQDWEHSDTALAGPSQSIDFESYYDDWVKLIQF